MLDFLRRIWARANTHWNRGGGHITARLWWLAFGLNLINLCLLMPLCFDEEDNGSERAASYADLQQMSHALHLYSRENDGRLPPMNNVPTLRHATAHLITPTPRPMGALGLTSLQYRPYATNPTLGFCPLRAYPHPDTTVVLWDRRNWDGGDGKYRQVSFLNGETKFIKKREWERLRLLSRVVTDTPAPQGFWWGRFALEDTGFVVNTAFVLMMVSGLGASIASFAAAWKDAKAWAGTRQNPESFRRNFVGFLLVQLFGYGIFMFLAATTASILINLGIKAVT